MITTIIDGIFAMLAAIGTVTIVWMIIGIFVRTDKCKGVKVYTVIVGCDDNNAYGVLDSLRWRQDMLPEEREVIVCGDVDLDKYACDAGRRKQCERITVLSVDRLSEYVKEQIAENSRDKNGAGNDNPGGNC